MADLARFTMRFLFLFMSLLVAAISVAQTQKASGVVDFISIDTPVFVLDHVRVIDGTGAPAKEDQAIVIANGKIKFIGSEASVQIPQSAQRIDRSGYTVIPGLVGMHNHLYYTDSYTVQVVDGKVGEPGLFIAEIPYTAPRLYLAAGVTTMYDRKSGALRRPEGQEPDRCKPNARPKHRCDRTILGRPANPVCSDA
jgi:hypothetical protein